MAVATGAAVALAVQDAANAAAISRSTADIIQIIGAVSAAAVVIGGVIVSIITARIKTAVANAVAPVAASVAEVKTQGDTIKASVDGTASRMEAALATALKDNERLLREAGEQKHIAALLAQSAASRTRVGDDPLPPATAQTTLTQIEANTDATAKNTAKTDATVTELNTKQP